MNFPLWAQSTVIQSVCPITQSGPVDALFTVCVKSHSIFFMEAQFLFAPDGKQFSKTQASGGCLGKGLQGWVQRFLCGTPSGDSSPFLSSRPLCTSQTDQSYSRELTAWTSLSAGPATSTSCLRHTVSLLYSALISPGTVLHMSSQAAWTKGSLASTESYIV